jgi:hypothetical protein
MCDWSTRRVADHIVGKMRKLQMQAEVAAFPLPVGGARTLSAKQRDASAARRESDASLRIHVRKSLMRHNVTGRDLLRYVHVALLFLQL